MARSLLDSHHALFAVHGLGLQLACDVPGLWGQIDHLLGSFGVLEFPVDFTTTVGHVRAYDESEVARSVSTSAVRVAVPDELLEMYQDGERFWLVDERWGICELNVLKGTWRSWVLEGAGVDEFRCVEMAVLWPLAQLLKRRGLELIPAVSVEREGFGVLMLSGFNLLPELDALLRHAGFKLIGQRWTALRDDENRIELLHLPGRIEHTALPRPGTMSMPRPGGWIDLQDDHGDAQSTHGYCKSVLLIEPGRRRSMRWEELRSGGALAALRENWPMIDLQPSARASSLVARLARSCPVGRLQLSRDPHDLIVHLDQLQDQSTSHVAVSISRSACRGVMARTSVAG